MASDQRDQLTVTNPWDKSFTVKWGGNPFTLNPGQQIIWPRYIAEHFAKRLTDAMLLEREQAHKKQYKATGAPMSEYIAPALLNSRKERPAVIRTILLGVYNYYQQNNGGRAAQIQQEIDQWNNPPAVQQQPQHQDTQETQSREQNLGTMDDPLLGVLGDDDEEETPEVTNPPALAAPASPQNMNDVISGADPAVPTAQPAQSTVPPQNVQQMQPVQPTTPIGETGMQKHNRLVKEAKHLGLKVTPGMNNEALEQAIKKQYA